MELMTGDKWLTYQIPENSDIATEGIVTADYETENIDLLKQKKPLILISNDPNPMKYDKLFKGLARDYKFKGYTVYNADDYYLSYQYPDSLKMNEDLKETLKAKVTMKDIESEKTKWRDIYSRMLSVTQEWAQQNNMLVIMWSRVTYVFTFSFLRDYPIYIIGASSLTNYYNQLLRQVGTHGVLSGVGKGLQMAKLTKKDYANRFSKKIPPFTSVNASDITLYHISLTPGITRMELRVTGKPLEYENVIIPRISAARTLSQCLGATGYLGQRTLIDKLTIYVYKLKLKPDTRIVKPTKKLVPDVEATGEYWVLDEVDVDYLGIITATRPSPNAAPKLDYTKLNIDQSDINGK